LCQFEKIRKIKDHQDAVNMESIIF
jgi:hypothetical protein